MQGMIKKVRSENYNYNFNRDTGLFIRWGKTAKDDPEFSPFGPEIMDIEISTICHGICGKPCSFCYKANTANGYNMTLDQFKELFAKFPDNLTQIAFGIGDIDSNPDMFPIFEYSRSQGVIPNVTTNGWGVTEAVAEKLAETCGAVAVSRYEPKDVCYDAVDKLGRLMKQVNIHMLVADETYDNCLQLIEDATTDSRLKGLNAIVFLALKQKGRGTWMHALGMDKYKELIRVAMDKNVRIGFDSCSANKFLKATEGHEKHHLFKTMAEPCESGLFSLYIDVNGIVHPCSFMEHVPDIMSIDLFKVNDFMAEVWNSPSMEEWRQKLVASCRSCPIYMV